MLWLLFFMLSAVAVGQTPAEVIQLFREVATDLAQNEPSNFLDHFDRNMPGYTTLRDEIEGLLSAEAVGTDVEIVTDHGDEQKRILELDWQLAIGDQQPKRALVKCSISREGKKWKITALDPVGFFKYSPL